MIDFITLKNKIALGTVQFGMDYGINNSRGRVPEEEVRSIIDFAGIVGIDTLDTAAAYGDSEQVIGKALSGNKKFKIVSKLPADVHSGEVANTLSSSLERLKVQKLYGYILHSFQSFKAAPGLYKELERLRTENKVQKIGFSVYYPEDIVYLLESDISFDLVQFPFSVFDQRFSNLFEVLKKKNVELHVRSVFLQGLFFKEPSALPPFFQSIKKKISCLKKLSSDHEIPVYAILLGFALLEQQIDRVVIGVDSLRNLQDNLDTISYLSKVERLRSDLLNLREENEEILLPFKWKIN